MDGGSLLSASLRDFGEALIVGETDERQGRTSFSSTGSSANPMNIHGKILWEIKVDYCIDVQEINTTADTKFSLWFLTQLHNLVLIF